MTIIQHAVWLYHRFPLSYRDVQELLHQRGIQISHETLREWCIKFGPFFAEDLRDQPHLLMSLDSPAIGYRHTGALLTAMLKGEETEKGDAGDFF